jgi:hypothetical protein
MLVLLTAMPFRGGALTVNADCILSCGSMGAASGSRIVGAEGVNDRG